MESESIVYKIGTVLGALGALAAIACGVVGVILIAVYFDDPELHRRGIGLTLISLLARRRA